MLHIFHKVSERMPSVEKIFLFALLFHSLPEAILVGVAGLVFVGIKPEFRKAVVFGII